MCSEPGPLDSLLEVFRSVCGTLLPNCTCYEIMCLPVCVQPLATLPAEEGGGAAYKNGRYFFTLLSLVSLCLPLHTLLSYAGHC